MEYAYICGIHDESGAGAKEDLDLNTQIFYTGSYMIRYMSQRERLAIRIPCLVAAITPSRKIL